jgi:thioredoxin-like negative regulator of GroEL
VSDAPADTQTFVKKGGWQFPVATAGDDIAAAYGVRGIPTVFVLDAQGRIKKTFVGGTDAATLSSIVDDLTD